ncbi:hypothetical protein ACHAQA_006483 [Verticillium albo-atrum]
MYDAVRRHPAYHVLADEIQGLPEARVFQRIAERWYGLSVLDSSEGLNAPGTTAADRNSPAIVVEDQSTNCGANAMDSKNLLDAGGVTKPRSIIVVQDATMSRRTVASFEKVYSELGEAAPTIKAWPTFVPEVNLEAEVQDGTSVEDLIGQFEFSGDGPRKRGLWDMHRFLNLVVGEIPRLRDDDNGYGPRGKGFITHVDVPEEAEEAWGTLTGVLKMTNR